jgi:protein-disulfide isomerase
MKDLADRVASIAIAAAAVVMAGSLVHREMSGGPGPGGTTTVRPDFLASWRDILSQGVRIGDSSAKVKIIEFADLQCPFCRSFQRRANAIRSRYGKDVEVVYVHFPLDIHRFARQAAHAAECAHAQGSFPQFIDQVYAKQDSVGAKTWAAFAADAGVPDAAAFARCIASDSTPPRVDAGLELGERLGVGATPTVIVNGWRFPSPPSESVLSETVSDLLAGRKPAVARGI